ncbi:MAG: hypothetical protein LBL21_02260 [Rickettsiales bacterium]|jgi:hypothetical protein|nr:hypothetical protein [Rickettsiales bacterium]
MPNFKKTQNFFGAGEISPDFFGRDVAGALSKLENASILPSGALARRPGTIRVGEIDNPDSVIIPFGGDYLLAVSADEMLIYKDNAPHQSISLDWDIGNIRLLQWAQRVDTMIFAHPDVQPKMLQKKGDVFSFSNFLFARDANQFPIMPFMRYPDTENASFTVAHHANGTNWGKLTSILPIWEDSFKDAFMTFMGRKFQVYSVLSPREIVVATTSSFSVPADPVSEWKEAVFSNRRGWPGAITFYQDRLVFGGTRGWPGGLWLSKTGAHGNFDAGTGLDDEAIFVTLLSETEQKIRACVASRDLIVLTDSGEWSLSSVPLTPSTINIRQHTSVGTASENHIQPQKVNGNTVFASKNEIRELALDELGESYDAADLALTAKHLIDAPVSMAYSAELCQLFVVMKNGTMAVLTKQPATGVLAWSAYRTAGAFRSVAVQSGSVYAIAERESGTYLEVFSESAANDSGECDFGFRAASAPLLIDRHAPRKIRAARVSVRVEKTKHVNISDMDFYYGDPFSGDITANILGSAADSSAPLWTVSSGEQANAKILAVSVDGAYEL